MKLVSSIAALRAELSANTNVGFVPTMGFLHEGHLTLARRSVSENDVTVMSIFVNPLQFAPSEDLSSYPRDIERDTALAETAGVDFLFVPSVAEMSPMETVEVGRIGQICEGEYRPGHFTGVATVCARLFEIVGPCRAYFGMKDAQQMAVVRKMVRETRLPLPIEVIGCPTVREADGLALSSRNVYLDPQQRQLASAIPKALFAAAELTGPDAEARRAFVVAELDAAKGVTLQYVDIVDPETFESLQYVKGRAIVVLAAFVGNTRLIDNVEVGTDVGTGQPA